MLSNVLSQPPGVVSSESRGRSPPSARKVSGATFNVGVMNSPETITVTQFACIVSGLLDQLDCNDLALLPDRQQLSLIADLLGVQGRLAGVLATVLQAAETSEAALTAHGTTTVTWLAGELCYTRREASAMVHYAKDLTRFGQVHQALLEGAVSERQANAISRVLRKLPDDLGPQAERDAQATMVGFCDQFDSQALIGLTHHLLEVVAPEVADEADAARIERELAAARRDRHLSFTDDGHGSTLIRGSLPTVDAMLLKAQIDAIASHSRRTALELRDPLAETRSTAMRRADALVDLARHIANCAAAPKHGGDRPHIVVTMNYQDLVNDCRHGGLIDDTTLTPSQLRRWACDAGIIPVVLGSNSMPLDVGREQRLVTPDIRHALHARDKGCVFPGCNRSPADCDAHHIQPWQQGGHTSLNNLALLCSHHHNLCEPRTGPDDRHWQVRIGANGIAEVIPPRFVDPDRHPRKHQRFRLPGG